MLIKAMLNEDRTRAKIEDASKKRVLETLACVFADSIESLDADALFQAFIKREKLGSTGIGEGIAVPHCRFDTGDKTYAACLSLLQPVDFDAFDDQPVDIVFAMLVPQNAEQSHLESLASVAEAMQTPGHVEALRAAKDNSTLYSKAIGNH